MKTKKKGLSPNKNDPNNQNYSKYSWPNLPQRLIKHLQKHSSMMPTINFNCVTKSWRSHTNKRHCSINPYDWLIESDQDYNFPDENTQNHVNSEYCRMSFPRDTFYWVRWRQAPKQYPWQHFLGCCHGHLVVRRVVGLTTELNIFNPVDTYNYSQGWTLPSLEDDIPVKCVAISSPPSEYDLNRSCMVMVVTAISSPAFIILTGEAGNGWIKQDCTIVDPHDETFRDKKCYRREKCMRFTNVIGVNGKFFALSSQGTLAVIERVDEHGFFANNGQHRFEITCFGKTRAIPSVICKGFRECLIEYEGDILLVFLVFGKEDRVVDAVEVYKLCLDDLCWIKMKSLDEKTLFVGSDCCILVSAEKVGCKGNCVYFTQQKVGGIVEDWFEYDMHVGQISSRWTHTIPPSNTKYMEWDEPIAEEDDLDLIRNREIIGYPRKYYY
ncbi:hypothetical protein CsatB_028247 [Cannabis sativa]